MFDREMRYLAVSRRWCADYGLESRELLGRSHYAAFPELPDHLKVIHQRALAGETIRAAEDRFVRQDGSVQWLHWEVCPWHAAAGPVGGIAIFSEDIIERKQIKEAEAAVRRYQQIVPASSEMLFLVDREQRFQLVNPAFAEFYGVTPAALRGHSVQALVGETLYARLGSELAATLSGEHRRFVIQTACPDGQDRFFEVSHSPFRLGNEVHGVVVALHDCTEIQEARVALEAERARLEERVIARTAEPQASEAKLRLIYDLLPVGIAITNPTGQVVDCNQALEEFIGMRLGEGMGMTSGEPLVHAYVRQGWSLVHPDGSPLRRSWTSRCP